MRIQLNAVWALALGLALVQSLTGCGSDDPAAAAPLPADVAVLGADLALPASAKGTVVADTAAALADLADLAPPDSSALPGAGLMPPD